MGEIKNYFKICKNTHLDLVLLSPENRLLLLDIAHVSVDDCLELRREDDVPDDDDVGPPVADDDVDVVDPCRRKPK